jgi:hypothetical protein
MFNKPALITKVKNFQYLSVKDTKALNSAVFSCILTWNADLNSKRLDHCNSRFMLIKFIY